jgi:hypothetical protein
MNITIERAVEATPEVHNLIGGCGGVAIFDDCAEVKRMYTRPVARGRGVAIA